jgi:hypothetical protein
VQGHLGHLRGRRQACVTLAAPCRALGVRLTVFMTRVYDLQLLFGLCSVTRSEARSAGSLGSLERVSAGLRYTRRAMPASQNMPGHVYDQGL